MERRAFTTGLGAVSLFAAPGSGLAAPRSGGAINVAIPGEPPTLDPMDSTADIVALISQHVFETLYTWGKGMELTPLLAAAMPVVSDGGRDYAIPLRRDVRFHDGGTMSSADVLASLQRWLKVAARGRLANEAIEACTAPDANTIRLRLRQPYAPLLALMSLQANGAVIMPAGKQGVPMVEVVGTGPFRLKERLPDRYILLTRFAEYSPRDDEPNGYGGRRTAYLDEVRFVPVPNASTRLEGALSGQYHYADSLPVETHGRLLAQRRTEPLLIRNYGQPQMTFNTTQGAFSNVTLRQAALASLNMADMLEAAFGDQDFSVLEGSFYPKGARFYSTARTELYNQANPARARELLKTAGYDGRPVRFMASQQVDFHFKIAQIAAENMRQAGFKVTLTVLDLATILQRRSDPALWEITIGHAPVLPEPSLYTFMSPTAFGWWSTPARDAAVAAFNGETDLDRRATVLWPTIQRLMYEEVPTVKIGNFAALAARSKALAGVQPAAWPFFWNTWLEQA